MVRLRLTENVSIACATHTYLLILHIFHVFLLEEQQGKRLDYLVM